MLVFFLLYFLSIKQLFNLYKILAPFPSIMLQADSLSTVTVKPLPSAPSLPPDQPFNHLNLDKSRPQSYYSARLISDTFKEPHVESHLSSVSTFIPKAETYDCAPPDHFYRNPYLKETFIV